MLGLSWVGDLQVGAVQLFGIEATIDAGKFSVQRINARRQFVDVISSCLFGRGFHPDAGPFRRSH
jgi:hypothetical protein